MNPLHYSGLAISKPASRLLADLVQERELPAQFMDLLRDEPARKGRVPRRAAARPEIRQRLRYPEKARVATATA